MFKYTKEIIINTNDKNLVKVSNGYLTIRRGGEYKIENMGKLYKTVGNVGTSGKVTLKTDKLTTPGLYRVSFGVKSIRKFTADMANANYNEFGREFVVEVSLASAEEAESKLTSALKSAMNVDIATVDGLTINLIDPYFAVSFVEIAKYDEDKEQYVSVGIDRLVDNEYTTNVSTIVKNVEPFATGEWIRENLRFPSYPNLRHSALYEDEQPVPGAIYTQYAFSYTAERIGLGGLSAVGQKIESVTQHIFYVNNAATNVIAALDSVSTPDVDTEDDETDFLVNLPATEDDTE